MAGIEEPRSGNDATVGGEVENLPAGPSSDPTKPGASIALAAGPGFGDPKPPSPFVDDSTEAERDARDGPLKPRVRDLLSEAVGAEMYGVNWNDSGWKDSKDGHEFTVSRYYMHPRIAVDFPDERELEHDVPMKREVLHRLGIAYIVVAPKESKDKNEIITAIAAERKLLKGGE